MTALNASTSSLVRALPGPTLETTQRALPGLALSATLAACAMLLGRIGWLQSHGFSALTLAIVLGMLIGNTVYPRLATISGAGVELSRSRLLRLGVVLYGLRLTLQDVAQVGFGGVAIDALVLGSTFALACIVGTRVFGIDRKTAMLIGAGSSICGAAAVMATGPVVHGRAEQVTVAVATVVVFGTVAIFLYPLLYVLNQHWQLIPGGAAGFGLYAGSTIHEVAQVVAAAGSIDVQAADTAVIAKMVRVMLLAPFLIVLSAWLVRDASGNTARAPAESAARHDVKGKSAASRIAVPWFAFGFIAVVLFNSLQLLPPAALSAANTVDTVLMAMAMAMAMAALGLTTHVSAIRKAGIRPLLLALVLFAWLVAGGALINAGVTALLG